MKTYRKTATVQGLPVTPENLPELLQLPQVSYLKSSNTTAMASKLLLKLNTVVIVDDGKPNTILHFFVQTKEGTKDGQPGDVLLFGNQGNRCIWQPQVHPNTYSEVATTSPALKESFWLHQEQLLGTIAHWAVRLSPYPVPANLEVVLTTFAPATASLFDGNGMREMKLAEVSALLNEHLLSQPQVQAWNERRNGNDAPFQFVSRYDGPGNPNDDFVDLDAFTRNILSSIEQEKGEEQAFEDEFKDSWAREVGQARAYLGEVIEWVKGKEAEVGSAAATWPTGESVKESALSVLKLVREHIEEVASGIDQERAEKGWEADRAIIPLPETPQQWLEAARAMMQLIMLDNGAVNAQEPLSEARFPAKYAQPIADAAQAYFTAHPQVLTEYNVELMCTGSPDEEAYEQLPPFEELNLALNAFFDVM